MREKIYEKFKAKSISLTGLPDNSVNAVVTDDEDELLIALIPHHIKNSDSVAKALAEALTKSQLALTDLI